MLTIEYEKTEERCAHCGAAHSVVRGPVLHEGSGVGLFLAGLHACTGDRMTVITVSLVTDGEPFAFTLQAWATDAQYEMAFVDSDISLWASDGYLGTLLSDEAARSSQLREAVFEVADLICATIPEATAYLEAMLDT